MVFQDQDGFQTVPNDTHLFLSKLLFVSFTFFYLVLLEWEELDSRSMWTLRLGGRRRSSSLKWLQLYSGQRYEGQCTFLLMSGSLRKMKKMDGWMGVSVLWAGIRGIWSSRRLQVKQIWKTFCMLIFIFVKKTLQSCEGQNEDWGCQTRRFLPLTLTLTWHQVQCSVKEKKTYFIIYIFVLIL